MPHIQHDVTDQKQGPSHPFRKRVKTRLSALCAPSRRNLATTHRAVLCFWRPPFFNDETPSSAGKLPPLKQLGFCGTTLFRHLGEKKITLNKKYPEKQNTWICVRHLEQIHHISQTIVYISWENSNKSLQTKAGWSPQQRPSDFVCAPSGRPPWHHSSCAAVAVPRRGSEACSYI